jgi:hypothetical protein
MGTRHIGFSYSSTGFKAAARANTSAPSRFWLGALPAFAHHAATQ